MAKKLTEEQRKKMLELHSEGIATVDIASRFGCARGTVAHILKAAKAVTA